MNMETIREWLGRKPFEPFVLKLSSGETYEVRHPENVIVLKSRLILGFPETDHSVHVSLIHINSIQALQTA